MLISLIPVMAISRVRGIGVADMESTSTFVFMSFNFSLCSTPKRCSSSMMMSPRSLNFTPADNNLCVPITTSTSPVARAAIVSFDSLVVWNLDSALTFTGKPANLSIKVSTC